MANPDDNHAQLEYAQAMFKAAAQLADKAQNGNPIDSKTAKKNRDYWTTQGLKIVKKLAAVNYAPALFEYGVQSSDKERAFDLYNKAAGLSHPEASYRVGVCFELGIGTRRDARKAVLWYKRAADLGDTKALYKLGMTHLHGTLGEQKNIQEAVALLEEAAAKADSENPHALHELALLYERPTYEMSAISADGRSVVRKDETRALSLFMAAGKLGYPPSQFRLGCCYEYGTLGCDVNAKKSIAWYSYAAQKGEPESELALSGWYLTGSDGILQQSDTEAYLWARKAAEKGLVKAEYALGYFCEVGIGVHKDLNEAKKWYFKAAAQKHPKAISRLKAINEC
jgi:TPR repeat protein